MVNRMYRLCNFHKWFTSGGVEQYNKLFEMVETNRCTKDLALVIYVCSDGWKEEDIYKELVEGGFPE